MHTSHIRVILEVVGESTVVGLKGILSALLLEMIRDTYSEESQRQGDRGQMMKNSLGALDSDTWWDEELPVERTSAIAIPS
jgi:hypothetical protein